jgi:hypothetical protein
VTGSLPPQEIPVVVQLDPDLPEAGTLLRSKAFPRLVVKEPLLLLDEGFDAICNPRLDQVAEAMGGHGFR